MKKPRHPMTLAKAESIIRGKVSRSSLTEARIAAAYWRALHRKQARNTH